MSTSPSELLSALPSPVAPEGSEDSEGGMQGPGRKGMQAMGLGGRV